MTNSVQSLIIAVAALLHTDSLISLGFFSFGFYLLFQIMQLGVVGLWIIALIVCIVLTFALQQYCGQLIAKACSFSKQPVSITADYFIPFSSNKSFVFHLFLFIGSFELVQTVLGDFLGFKVITFVFLLFIPASYAVLGMTNDALTAINPSILAEFIKKIKSDYLGILAISFLTTVLVTNSVTSYTNPSYLQLLVTTAVVFVWANYIGAVIACNREELGLVDPEDERENRAETKYLRTFEFKVYQLIAVNKHAQAAELIESELALGAGLTDEHIHSYLVESNYVAVAVRHADKYIERLVAQNKIQKAWRVLVYAVTQSDRYYIEKQDILSALINGANTGEQDWASITLLLRLANASDTEPATKKSIVNQALRIAMQKIQDEKLTASIKLKLHSLDRVLV